MPSDNFSIGQQEGDKGGWPGSHITKRQRLRGVCARVHACKCVGVCAHVFVCMQAGVYAFVHMCMHKYVYALCVCVW